MKVLWKGPLMPFSRMLSFTQAATVVKGAAAADEFDRLSRQASIVHNVLLEFFDFSSVACAKCACVDSRQRVDDSNGILARNRQSFNPFRNYIQSLNDVNSFLP